VAEILPFRGVRYNQGLAGELASVICPPYDIITPQLQQELYHRSAYNFVRLEFGRESPQDTSADNRYTRSAATLEQWLMQGVLAQDQKPAIYLHDHYFNYGGKEYRRRGIVAAVRLEEWDKKIVRPHEGTLAEHKSDRLSLLWALEANTSPVLSLFDGGQVSSLLAAQEKSQPIISLSGEERHKVWAITEPKTVEKLSGAFAPQPLYIADGHHRYESALTYRRERLACSSSVSGEGGGNSGFNFVMMTLVDFADPGLLILPPHRLLRGLSRAVLGQLAKGLESFFAVEELPLATSGVWQRVDDFLGGGNDEVRLVVFGVTEGNLLLLRLRDAAAASKLMPSFHSEIYKKLNVSVLDHVILEKLLGVGGGEEASLDYTYSREDAVNRVVEQEFQLAFLLSPVKPGVIKAIADAGDRMPRKSTYFYPKAPAGLVLHWFK
jgi:uncharacterized protein (DUF1015 family)